jgi:squalene-hopene/tetraprenyl-beta-curcumene cyclase
MFEDGSYEWMVCLLADMFRTSACNVELEGRSASSALRRIEYQRGGWLRGREVSTNIFDTGLTVLALRAAQIPRQDPLISRAVAFLKEAASPDHHMWSWSYYPGMGANRRYLDTDDTGLACMAVASCGEPEDSQILTEAAKGLLRMQENSGAFSTFGDGAMRPNWCWISNSARALQALIASGLSLRHESVARAVNWLLSQQQPDGAWVDGWCSRYIYGTVIALEALVRTNAVSVGDSRTVRAVEWIVKEQNADGGWGEDWRGARSSSTAEHTGLAVYALCVASAPESLPVRAIEAGLHWLIENQRSDGSWRPSYFVNFGLGSGFANSQMPVVWALHGLGQAMEALARDKLEAA